MKRNGEQKQVQLKQIEKKQDSLTKNQSQKIYFQQQDLNLLCGMHSLNNFLGQPKFNVESLNEICYQLASGKKVLNPHKHWIMQGDYDVNVLMYALQDCGFVTKWHDKRKSFQSKEKQEVQGFLVNIEVKSDRWFRWSGLCCASGRHWLTIKKLSFNENKKYNQNSYVILDSSKQTYEMKTQQQLLKYLNQVQNETAQVISIYKQTNKKHQ